MKTYQRILRAAVLAAVLSNVLNAQWVNIGGLDNRSINCLTVSGQYLLAGTGSGLYYSTDNGKSWTAPQSGAVNLKIKSFIAGDSVLYGCTSDYTAYMSVNHGLTWTRIDSGIGYMVRAFTVSGSTVYAGTEAGIYYSSDNGSTWNATDSMLGKSIYSLGVYGSDIYAGTFDSVVYRSTNGGASWFEADAGLHRWQVRSFVVSDTAVFAATDSGVFRSSRSTTQWSSASTGLNDHSINALLMAGGALYAGTTFGVSKSVDSGLHWTLTDSSIVSYIVYSLATDGTNLFAGSAANGVFRSTDSGGHWSDANAGISSTLVYSIGIDSQTVLVGTFNSIFRSFDCGTTWLKSNSDSLNSAVYCLYSAHPYIFAGTQGQGILVSTDSGSQWAFINSGLTNLTVHAVAATGTMLFAATEGGVFKSSDHGSSWTTANSRSFPITSYVFLSASGTSVFAGPNSGGLYRSTDNGSSWTSVGSASVLSTVYCQVVLDTTWYIGTGSGIFYSTNQGTSWTVLSSNLTGSIGYLRTVGKYLFVGKTALPLVYISTDRGLNWTEIETAVPASRILSYAVNDTALFAASYGYGIWRRPLSEILVTGIDPKNAALPERASLLQNYPNPFNPSTTISYQLPVSGHVLLQVYNILGKEVAMLVNAFQKAGSYTMQFTAGTLPSGVYFYRLKAGTYSVTRKFVLLK